MNAITTETLDRDIELQDCANGLYFTSGAELVSDLELYRQYRAAIRIIAELESEFASAPDGASVCQCGQPAEYTGGVCRDCHESAIDLATTQYEASYRQGAL